MGPVLYFLVKKISAEIFFLLEEKKCLAKNYFWQKNYLWQLAVDSWQVALDSWQVAVGRWRLVGGSWQVVVSRWQVEGGMWPNCLGAVRKAGIWCPYQLVVEGGGKS